MADGGSLLGILIAVIFAVAMSFLDSEITALSSASVFVVSLTTDISWLYSNGVGTGVVVLIGSFPWRETGGGPTRETPGG